MTKERDRLCPDAYNQVCYSYFNRIYNDIRYYLYPNKYEHIQCDDKIDKIYKIDNLIKDKFDNFFKDKFDNIFKDINDPILKHIAIYLIANYAGAHVYFSNDGKWVQNPACESLNKWLDNRKSYFTLALNCKGNVHLWDNTIEALWKELESIYKNNGSNKKWCERYNLFRGSLDLPKGLPPPMCYKHVPKDYICVRPFPPNMCNLANTYKNNGKDIKSYYEICKKNKDGADVTDFSLMISEAIANGYPLFKGIHDITFSRQVQKNFTPLGSKMSYRGINKKRIRDNFNEEPEYEEYARSIKKNLHRGCRRNNIYYHSVRN
ncbi:variable surface protein [Plasmodium gonderi]|uniref:Variable surface protein n=1 Tax=Plasmodium gonderi TaxID=77519 RepID=A0A1Y1JIG9_PLAGO|nr:variable surface protein [Plasmodium gonderi]GAW82020.1 variable surface protein [Plasmodium gonderi]